MIEKSMGTRVAYILIDGLQGTRSIVASVGKTAIVWAGDSVGFTGGAIVKSSNVEKCISRQGETMLTYTP